MDSRTSVLIVESNLARLTGLMLWLEQFPEFKVDGTLNKSPSALADQDINNYEIVVLAVDDSACENIIAPRALSAHKPAIVLIDRSTTNKQITDTKSEYQARLPVDAPLKDLYDQLSMVANRKKQIASSVWLPASKAS
jgi:hypothetical protein